jgi:hypothetical protein
MPDEHVAFYLHVAHDLKDGLDFAQLAENWRLP